MTAYLRLAPLLIAVALAGCEVPAEPGRSALDAELKRREGETGVVVMTAAPGRAEIVARGREIVVEPPKGFCLDEDSVSASDNAAFAIVADCRETREPEAPAALTGENTFPGILTMTISGEDAFGSGAAEMDAFEGLLTSEEGLKLLGRGSSDAPGEVIALERIGGALYVLVDEGENAGEILSPRFWRAFTGINGRMVLITVSGFKGREAGEGSMLRFLARQMMALRRVNGMPQASEETRIATAAVPPVPEAAGVQGEGKPAESPGPSSRTAPGKAPKPPHRPA